MQFAGETKAAISEGLRVLPALGNEVASVRTLEQLRPIRDVADEDFRDRFDAITRAMDPGVASLT